MARTAAPRNTSTPVIHEQKTNERRSRRNSESNKGQETPRKTRTNSAAPRVRLIKKTVRIQTGRTLKRKNTEMSLPEAKKNRPGQGAEAGGDDVLFKKMCDYMDMKFDKSDQKVTSMSNKVDSVSESVAVLTSTVEKNKQDISAIQKQIDVLRTAPADGIKRQVQKALKDMEDSPGMGLGDRGELNRLGNEINKLKTMQQERRGSDTTLDSDERNYWLARRAVRLWPVEGRTSKDLWSATGRFFFDILKVPESNLEESSVESIKKVSPQNRQRSRRTNVTNEVVVYLKDVSTRDMIQSYATNLADHRGKAGLRLEVPCHLTGCFKCLERCGHLLKKQHPGLKWHVNFDDVEMSLRLSFRLPDGDNWERMDFAAAREMVRKEERLSAGSLRGRIESTLSNESGRGSEDQEEEIMEIEAALPKSATLVKYRGAKKTGWGENK